VSSLYQPPKSDHVVQFYETDAELIARVGRYLREAQVAVAIATQPHRAALAAALPERDDIVWLDAHETLGRFTRHGRIDHAAFDEVVGGVVRAAVAGGRPVRAFGEMVALLWERGDVAGALELEGLWNGLQVPLPFSLYCAYPTVVDAEEFAGICEAHTAVEASWDFPAVPTAPTSARHDLASALRRLGYDDALLDDARIVVTELAANAVAHARSPFSVSVRGDVTHVRIGVCDRSRALPALQPSSSSRLSGRGLQLVAAIAGRWGVEPLSDGKLVWADLRA
jgi:anti-sigma regulatory factor (Ser/Thr protein kinase)